ncbi:uncharacterized protein LOC135297037 isoform X3 [Passer domesticus]|uniref:uncharacterized protein LOC135297037 isoform X3 n=1 Tax=Passer domesticus TaxID=48849 RepID=UPI0030FE1E70
MQHGRWQGTRLPAQQGGVTQRLSCHLKGMKIYFSGCSEDLKGPWSSKAITLYSCRFLYIPDWLDCRWVCHEDDLCSAHSCLCHFRPSAPQQEYSEKPRHDFSQDTEDILEHLRSSIPQLLCTSHLLGCPKQTVEPASSESSSLGTPLYETLDRQKREVL